MKVILTERQRLILESDTESWGCYLFPEKSENREWCTNASTKIKKKKSSIQQQIDRIGKYLKEDSEMSYREKVLYYTEGNPFFDENITNFKLSETLITQSCEKSKAAFNYFKSELSKKFLFVDKIQEEYRYSPLTKLNSNYTALAYLLTDYRKRASLVGMSFDEIFEKYFITPHNSMNESPFFNFIIKYFSGHNLAIEIMEKVLRTIKGTGDIGAATEVSAYKFLSEHFGENNIVVFSGDFSFPDFLGIDMVVNEEELGWGWTPVQVKTKIESCYGNRKFCKNICIGKNKTKNWDIKIYDEDKEIPLAKLGL